MATNPTSMNNPLTITGNGLGFFAALAQLQACAQDPVCNGTMVAYVATTPSATTTVFVPPPPQTTTGITGTTNLLTPPIKVSGTIVGISQIMGLVPVTNCYSVDCRQGIYYSDAIPNDLDFTLPVFASTSDTDPYKNDESFFLFNWSYGSSSYDPISSNGFQLQKMIAGTWTTVATLNDSTYGNVIKIGYGDSRFPGVYYAGYNIQWSKVLSIKGTGTYRFNISGKAPIAPHTYCASSPPYCLLSYSCVAADSTVRFSCVSKGGNVGDVLTQGNSWTLDGTGTYEMIIEDQIRFAGFFGYQTAEFQRDQIKYQTGIITKVRDEAIKKFTLKTDRLPKWLLDRFMAYALMADQLYVSDYNINNADYNIKSFYVVADSDFSPKYLNFSRYQKVSDLMFKEGQQLIYRDRV